MTMNFSPAPGPHERHLKRRLLNPLFPKPEHEFTQLDIEAAQKKDEENLFSLPLKQMISNQKRLFLSSLDAEKYS